MKKITISFFAAVAMLAYACNGGAHETENKSAKTAHAEPPASGEPVKQVKVTYTNVDAGVATHMKKLTDEYLALKNALTNGNANEAAGASKNMVDAMKGFDKSLLTAEQKQVYDAEESSLKENADHIAKSASDLKHQRERFSGLSEDMYTLVKAFGGGKILYHEYCPMARDDKGAMWLSESKAIRNPYFGDQMMECGTVEEEIIN
jgi:Protein of unknown function (DUF3347).